MHVNKFSNYRDSNNLSFIKHVLKLGVRMEEFVQQLTLVTNAIVWEIFMAEIVNIKI